jgi:hypothetical protein
MKTKLDYDLTLRLTKSFRRAADNLAPHGGPEVVHASVDFLHPGKNRRRAVRPRCDFGVCQET